MQLGTRIIGIITSGQYRRGMLRQGMLRQGPFRHRAIRAELSQKLKLPHQCRDALVPGFVV
jgi:hypothetical protein